VRSALQRKVSHRAELAAKLLCVDALTETSHLAVAVRIGNSDVGAGIGKVFEQMFHMAHRRLGGEALNDVIIRLSNDSPSVATASELRRKCSCGPAEGIRRYPLSVRE